MGDKRTILGDIAVSPANWEKVSALAKEGLKSRGIIEKLKKTIADLQDKVSEALEKILGLEKKLEGYEGRGLSDKMKYYQALQRAPRRLAEAVAEILRQPPEIEQQRQTPHRDRGYER